MDLMLVHPLCFDADITAESFRANRSRSSFIVRAPLVDTHRVQQFGRVYRPGVRVLVHQGFKKWFPRLFIQVIRAENSTLFPFSEELNCATHITTKHLGMEGSGTLLRGCCPLGIGQTGLQVFEGHLKQQVVFVFVPKVKFVRHVISYILCILDA